MKIGNGKLLKGDCLELMKEIPDDSIDMILCDLPYGTTQCKWDSIILFEPLWKEYWRITKSNAAIILTAAQPFTSALIMSQIKWFRYDLIWDKVKGTGFLNAKRMPMRNHETILVFYKKLPTYNPQKTKNHIRKVSYRAVKHRADDVYGSVKKGNVYDSTERYPRSIQTFSTDIQNSSLHPTQKPVALFEYLIKTYTDVGDTVLDNCSGSGTTAIAAERQSRKWVCIEKDTYYYYGSVARIATELDI